uniref:T9SS type A sorting domain-containing protein n=1 Tax=Ignavibacterium album TaxID=591197 RepID=A0A832DJG4_9BACT
MHKTKNKIFLVLFFLIISVSASFAQQLKLIVSNIKFESSNSLTFDVYLQNIGSSPFTFSNAAFVWNYDPAFLNGGTASFSLESGYSDFPSSALPPSALLTTSNIIRTSSNLPGSNGVIAAGESKRISRFRFQTSAANFNGTYFNLSWKNSVTPYTRVFGWNSVSGLPEEVTNLSFNVQQPLLVENFEYSGLLTNNGWTSHSGAGTNPISTTTGLTYLGYPGSGVGNAALIGNTAGEDVNRNFDSVFTDGASVYYSFLINVNELSSSKSGDYFIHIGDRVSPTSFSSFSARVFARVVSDQVNFGLSNTSTATYGTTNFSKNQTYLIVVKYTINAAGNDTTKFWVFSSGVPQSENQAGTPEVINSTTAGQNNIDAIGLRQGDNTQPSVIVDGIRIGRTWEDIVTIPSGPQLAATPTTLSGFTYFVGGGPSASQSYSLSGSDLTPASGNITVTAPTNYEISLNNSTFTNSLLIPYSGGTLSATPVYVRLKAGLAVGLYNGEVVTNSGGGATNAIVTCNGFVVRPEPTNHVTSFSGNLGNPSYYYINLNWTDATGGVVPDGYLIRASSISFDSIPNPVDGVPISNSTFNQNVSQGIQTATFGLNGGTTYYFKIFPYTNSGTLINYKTDGTIPSFSIATSNLPPLPIDENFNYAVGSLLTQNGWVAHSGSGTNSITVVDTNLSYTGYQNSNIGKAAYLTNTGEDVNRAFEPITSGSLYASFLVSIDSAQNAGEYFFHFGPENTTSAFLGKVWAKRDSISGNLAFGISKRNNNPDVIYSPPIYSFRTTYLLVVKYEFNDGGTNNDSIKLWINPVLDGNEPAYDLIVGDSGNDAVSLAMFALRQATISTSPKLFIDGIRVATSWIPVSSQTTFQLSVNVANGWNMVSVPGLHPVDQNVTTWWSGKDPAANVFRFQSGYQAVTSVQPGSGYWMKHLGANTYNTGDEWPAGGINIVPHDPINAASGWNLIGGYEFLAPTAALTTNPSGLISGFVYGYTPGSGYQVASDLVPGYGYWVKLTAAGQININPGPKANLKLADLIGENAGKIIITDNAGKSYTLYVTNDSKTSLDYFELPPVPFSDMFDVRYTSGRFVEELSSAIKTIQMQGVEYPVKVRVEGMMIRISDESGKVVNERIKSGEEVTISNPSVSKLNVMSDIIPDKYSLEQNYPNPFNPTTTIEFTLPEDVENVRLTIYNALGEKVAELVNGKMEAGRYRYQWNAGNVATGLYIYELKTNKFSSAKKMILMK